MAAYKYKFSLEVWESGHLRTFTAESPEYDDVCLVSRQLSSDLAVSLKGLEEVYAHSDIIDAVSIGKLGAVSWACNFWNYHETASDGDVDDLFEVVLNVDQFKPEHHSVIALIAESTGAKLSRPLV